MKTCVLILENLRSVENTGSIFRTAEGLGVKKIILVGTTPAPVDRFGRKRADFSKVALGAEEIVEWEHIAVNNLQSTINNFKGKGFKILALEQHPNSKPLQAESLELQSFALVVGNEVDGVSKDVLDIADEILEIPMQGEKESLNVSVSTGIALWALLK